MDILGHPWHNPRKLIAQEVIAEWRFEMIPEALLFELIDALSDHRVAIEINSRWVSMFAEPAFREFVGRLRDRGVQVAVGSDAHMPERIEAALSINAFLAEMGFDVSQVWVPEAARSLPWDLPA